MKVSAVNGSVSANNIRGTAKLSTVNGEVRADFDRLETGSKISLETVNGKVNLLLPSDANATLKGRFGQWEHYERFWPTGPQGQIRGQGYVRPFG
jgi:DUF4097 and DUF4098 domain-containing protein YvlB